MGCFTWLTAALVVLVGVGLALAGLSHGVRAEPAPTQANSRLVARATESPVYYGPNYAARVAPLYLILNGTASGGSPPYSYFWDFGDGGTKATQNTTPTYSLPGLYIARLTVTDAGGDRATSTVTTAASSIDGVNWVSAEPTPALGLAPLRVHFAVTSGGALPRSYDWTFGDGNTSTAPEANHTYERPGVYLARLNITNENGLTASYRMTVIVDGSDTLDALATVSVVGLCYQDVWNRATFEAFVGGGVTPYAYSWHFGDGNATSTATAPTHSYSATGLGVANLTVTDSLGNTASSSVGVAAVPPSCAVRVMALWVPLSFVFGALAALIVAVVLTRKRRRKDEP